MTSSTGKSKRDPATEDVRLRGRSLSLNRKFISPDESAEVDEQKRKKRKNRRRRGKRRRNWRKGKEEEERTGRSQALWGWLAGPSRLIRGKEGICLLKAGLGNRGTRAEDEWPNQPNLKAEQTGESRHVEILLPLKGIFGIALFGKTKFSSVTLFTSHIFRWFRWPLLLTHALIWINGSRHFSRLDLNKSYNWTLIRHIFFRNLSC